MQAGSALLSLRTAVILQFGLLAGLGAGALTAVSQHSPAGGVLAGGATFGAATAFFNAIIGRAPDTAVAPDPGPKP